MNLRETVARALCEEHIRNVRRFDTDADKLEAMMPEAVDYSWRDFAPQADASIATVMAALSEPSESVLDRGAQEFAMTFQRGNTAEAHAKSIWTAMLRQFKKDSQHEN